MAGITFTFASGLNKTVFGQYQAPIKMRIEKRGEAFEQLSMINKIFAMEKSTHFGETFTGLTGMQGFQPVGEMGSHPVDHMQESYKKYLENVTWKNSFSLSHEAVADAQNIDLKRRPDAFMSAYYRTREIFGAALLGNAIQGNATADFRGKKFDITTADGSNLFATNHPSILGGATQSNCFSDAMSADAVAYMESAMQDFKGDGGEILDVMPDTIIVPNIPALVKAAKSILFSPGEVGTANNTVNTEFRSWDLIIWPYLKAFITADTAPWVMMDSRYNKEYLGAVWLDREDLTVDSDIDKDTDANVWRGLARFTGGFNDWRAFAVGGISGGTALISD